MKPDFSIPIDRRNSDSIKWNFFDEDVLPLWVADMDFPAPPEVLETLTERINHGVFGYSRAQDSTRSAVQKWLLERHGWEISGESIVFVPGVVQSFNFAAKAFANPGDSVLIQTPAYHPFFHVHKQSNLKKLINRLARNADGRYYIDRDLFQADLRPDTRLYILCNPHNPSGRVFSRKELEQVAELCLENNTLICSDEIHSDLVYSPHAHIPIASISDEIADKTITLVSASKTFNIAGLKSSAVIIKNPRLREQFIQATLGLAGSVNVLGEVAMATAYDRCAPWLTDLMKHLTQNRDYLSSFIKEELPTLALNPPEATYLGWLDCSNTGLDDPGKFFLERARVGLNSGTWFGDEYKHFVRINFGCPRELLTEALQRMKKALDVI